MPTLRTDHPLLLDVGKHCGQWTPHSRLALSNGTCSLHHAADHPLLLELVKRWPADAYTAKQLHEAVQSRWVGITSPLPSFPSSFLPPVFLQLPVFIVGLCCITQEAA